MNELAKKEGTRIFCPTCGDVTKGHPEEDRLLAELLKNGFTTSYTNHE